MAGKAHRILVLVVPLLAGCALLEKKPPAEPPEAKQVVAPSERATRATTAARRTSAPSKPAKPATTSQTSAPIATPGAGNTFIVTKPGASAAPPVPLFRQAIVLANVRASVAGLPNPPQAEFRQGLLTLTFPSGSRADATAAINKALAVPEVTRVRANLPP
jgi:hypothetical protein